MGSGGAVGAGDLRLVLVTGLSGAGKTEASRALEDLGYYVVDNLPPALIPTFAELCSGSAHVDKAALVVDVRGRAFFGDLNAALQALEARAIPYEILFLEADDATLVRRYKESRRQHPLAPGGRIADGLAEERRRLQPLRRRASRLLDTSNLRPSELRRQLRLWYAPQSQDLAVTLVSFGFKHGLPVDADMVLDVRFLPNPHYDPQLRPRSGRDPAVAEYVLRAPVTRRFLELLLPLLDFLLPRYVGEGKSQLVLAVGCTGGRHRSVVIVERLAQHLRRPGYRITTVHRDCDLPSPDEAESGPAPPGSPRPGEVAGSGSTAYEEASCASPPPVAGRGGGAEGSGPVGGGLR